jgi:hypothetical protein
MFEFTMKRYGLDELHNAIKDNEERGYQVVSQIRCETSTKKVFTNDSFSKNHHEFQRTDGYELYYVRMRKVEPNEHTS